MFLARCCVRRTNHYEARRIHIFLPFKVSRMTKENRTQGSSHNCGPFTTRPRPFGIEEEAVVDADAGDGETFDEEAEERDHVEIEHLVGEFVNEPSVRHNQIPDSDDEEEKGLKKKPAEVTHIKRGDGKLYKPLCVCLTFKVANFGLFMLSLSLFNEYDNKTQQS
ncbi:hypothetical protein IGI04_002181 [Brassica rapa subsp. trilocularis]|uniref:Uncharacterized protein n=1 Tax=Brassica rapa subsp. trilocularis TaxID=1813537 RepID=A0ABQ7NY48_BRACM|nr:hypothetical protein IGI04_002181 [Brassica rapa subsp. trilocularis]